MPGLGPAHWLVLAFRLDCGGEQNGGDAFGVSELQSFSSKARRSDRSFPT